MLFLSYFTVSGYTFYVLQDYVGLANLPGGTLPNHVTFDGKSSVYAVNKARGADDAQGDRITRITPR